LIDLGFDRCVLRFQVYERNLHLFSRVEMESDDGICKGYCWVPGAIPNYGFFFFLYTKFDGFKKLYRTYW
jgi:hypothetical protein